MCYLFHVAVVYVLVGEIMSNHSYNFCMEGVLNAFFFWLFRWVTLDEMAFMSALHANQKPSTSAWHNHRAYCPYAFHLAMLPAFWCWWWGNRLPAKYTFCHLFCWRIRTTINTSSPYCFSLLSFPFQEMWSLLHSEPSKGRSNIVWYQCGAVCKHNFNNQWPSYFNCSQTQRGKKEDK